MQSACRHRIIRVGYDKRDQFSLANEKDVAFGGGNILFVCL